MEASKAAPPQQDDNVFLETEMNLAFLDPPRFGWTAIGGVVDVLPPHDRARRTSAQKAHVTMVKSRERRKERIEAKRRQEESNNTNVSEQGTEQIKGRQSIDNDAPDTKPAAVELHNSSVPQSNLPPPAAAAAVNGYTRQKVARSRIPGAAPLATTDGPAVNNEKSVPNQPPSKEPSEAGQGIVSAAIAGLASLVMNTDDKNVSTTETAAATTNGSSQVPPQKPPPSKATMSTTTTDSNVSEAGGVSNGALASSTDAGTNEPSVSTRLDDGAKKTADDSKAKDAKKKKQTDNTFKFKALNADGILDMFTYHRGREGLEPRDDVTGALLCDVDATDTNHGWEPPSLKISINISFPLCDGDPGAFIEESPSRRQSSHQEQDDSGLQYNETIEWDLADPKTMSPMCFATGISEEFGLDAGQTLDLAVSIQKQINYFVQNKLSYKSPLTLMDANGNERSCAHVNSPGMRGPPQLFGSVTGETQAGMPIPQKFVQAMKTKTPISRESSTRESVSSDRPSREVVATPLAEAVEPEYTSEVVRRAKQKSIQDVAKRAAEDGDHVRIMTEEFDTLCHVCRKLRQGRVWKCVCNNPFHNLCTRHLSGIFGISVNEDGSPFSVDYCPICAMKCTCLKCNGRLSKVARYFKSQCIQQGVPPEQAVCDDMLARCPSLIRETPVKRKGGLSGNMKKKMKKIDNKRAKTTATTPRRLVVPKVPVPDFPREVYRGQDMDPGTSEEYRTVYTSEGSFVREAVTESKDATVSEAEDSKLPAAVPPSNAIQEDGNVDYCHACMKHGDLMCCDFCPRAFHRKCLPTEELTNLGDTWECLVCRLEKDETDADVVTGESSVVLFCNATLSLKHSPGLEGCMHLLRLIHDTISKLMDYDFGNWFRQPVDSGAVPGYRAIVKHPMDLGTIASRIANGEYAEKYKENHNWDDVIVAVLGDIELVWHNCFTFNFEGSSVYRMAQVQRRKYLRIRQRSFDDLLTSETKQRVDEIVAKYEQERSKMPRVALPTCTDGRSSSARNKITINTVRKKRSKAIAVFDPDVGMVVKIYSTVKGAQSAARFLLGLGHSVEHESLTDHALKDIFRSSAKDPKMLLFGYRWLYMEELKNGAVKFGKPGKPEDLSAADGPPCIVEVKHGNSIFVFLSIEEALSWPGLPDEVSHPEQRQQLIRAPYNEWNSFTGTSWRKLQFTAQQAELSTVNADADLANNVRIVDISKNPFPPSVGFVKEDLITRRALVGFGNETAAYVDWLKTREGSPVSATDEQADFDYFASYYLDGERNIDGIIWRTVLIANGGAFLSTATNAVSEDVGNAPATPSVQETSSQASGIDSENFSRRSDGGNGSEPATAADAIDKRETPTTVLQEAQSEKTNGVHHTSTPGAGDVLGGKRTHENAGLGLCGPAKKAAVCHN